MSVDYPRGTHRRLNDRRLNEKSLTTPSSCAGAGAAETTGSFIPLESVEARQFLRLCTGASLILPDLAYIVHTPNGGYRRKTEAARMKGEGVRAGFPDYSLSVARGGFHGWYGELKRVKYQYPTDKQYEWLERFRDHGYNANWYRGGQAMFDALLAYLSLPLTQTAHSPDKSFLDRQKICPKQAELERKPVRKRSSKDLQSCVDA